jgi:hypothetical protein
MSAPAPLTVWVVPDKLELPAAPTAPTSWIDQVRLPGGPVVMVMLSKRAVASVPSRWLVRAMPTKMLVPMEMVWVVPSGAEGVRGVHDSDSVVIS